MCLDERRVSRVDLSRCLETVWRCDFKVSRATVTMMDVSGAGWSAFYTYNSKICDTKKCPVSCVQGPLWSRI